MILYIQNYFFPYGCSCLDYMKNYQFHGNWADGWRSTAHSWRSGQVRRLTAYSFGRSRGNGRYADSFRRSRLRWVAVCIV